MNESFIFRLKEERKRLGLTQQQAAAVVGVARETWSRYETGALEPGSQVVALLAAQGADVAYLLSGERSNTGGGDAFAAMAGAVVKLEPSGFGPIHDAFIAASEATGDHPRKRPPDFSKLQLALALCSEQDAELVLQSALMLATRLATAIHSPAQPPPPPPRVKKAAHTSPSGADDGLISKAGHIEKTTKLTGEKHVKK